MSDLFKTGMYAGERKARPLEAFCIGLSQQKRAFEDIKANLLHGPFTVRAELDPQGYLAAKCEEQIVEIDQRLESRAEALAAERRQFVQAERKKDKWASPSAPGEGWLCPDSPTGICTYENDTAIHDHCDYCGFPEERK
jgi:hypothetical protein